MIKVLLNPINAEGFIVNTEIGLKILWLDHHILKCTTDKILEKIDIVRINDFAIEDSYYRVQFSGADFLKNRNTLTIANDSFVIFNLMTGEISREINLSLLIEPFYRCFGYTELKYDNGYLCYTK